MGVFHKWGYPLNHQFLIIFNHFYRIFPYKPSILGYPHYPPFVEPRINKDRQVMHITFKTTCQTASNGVAAEAPGVAASVKGVQVPKAAGLPSASEVDLV